MLFGDQSSAPNYWDVHAKSRNSVVRCVACTADAIPAHPHSGNKFDLLRFIIGQQQEGFLVETKDRGREIDQIGC